MSKVPATQHVIIRILAQQDYVACWQAMKNFTDSRTDATPDEIWLVEHPPVFTQGQNGKAEHLLNAHAIPVIQSDRGGQITFHGPGQLMAYTLVDAKRKKFTVRQLVNILEQSVINTLKDYGINSEARCDAPGVYINNKKICSVGLRIRRGCSYHGLAMNLAMDLTPFDYINPCGFSGLEMTQLSAHVTPAEAMRAPDQLLGHLIRNLGYTSRLITSEHIYGS